MHRFRLHSLHHLARLNPDQVYNYTGNYGFIARKLLILRESVLTNNHGFGLTIIPYWLWKWLGAGWMTKSHIYDAIMTAQCITRPQQVTNFPELILFCYRLYQPPKSKHRCSRTTICQHNVHYCQHSLLCSAFLRCRLYIFVWIRVICQPIIIRDLALPSTVSQKDNSKINHQVNFNNILNPNRHVWFVRCTGFVCNIM